MWTWEPVGRAELEDGEVYFLNSFCADGPRAWVHFWNFTTKGWNFEIPGSSPIPLGDSSSGRPYLDFIDGALMQNGPPFVKNLIIGKGALRLSGKYAVPVSVQWDGQYLVAGY